MSSVACLSGLRHPARQVVSHSCSLFLWVLRCFTSPGARARTYVFHAPHTGFTGMGYPIRRFSDHRLLVTSPRLFADCHVLLRLLAAKSSTIRPYVPRPSGITTKHTINIVMKRRPIQFGVRFQLYFILANKAEFRLLCTYYDLILSKFRSVSCEADKRLFPSEDLP